MSLLSASPEFSISGVGTSINFFIPIADALKFLAVELVKRKVDATET